MSTPQSSSVTEMKAWLAKYTPVEQTIIAEREKRLAHKEKRLEERQRRFGNLCEATEGLAVRWRRERTPLAQQLAWADGDVFTVACILRAHATRRAERVRHALKRPLYYSAENARRRALAAERRRIRKRSTENPCPSREAVLDAWIHRRDSHAAAIRFGSLIEDLECYLDSSLRFDENGALVGRNGGVKRWLQTEIPALYLRYTTVMRFKAAARKLRQIVGVHDPIPAVRIIDSAGTTGEGTSCDVHLTPVTRASRIGTGIQVGKNPTGSVANPTRSAKGVTMGNNMSHAIASDLMRAHAKWVELTLPLAPNPTALFACLDKRLAFSGSA